MIRKTLILALAVLLQAGAGFSFDHPNSTKMPACCAKMACSPGAACCRVDTGKSETPLAPTSRIEFKIPFSLVSSTPLIDPLLIQSPSQESPTVSIQPVCARIFLTKSAFLI